MDEMNDINDFMEKFNNDFEIKWGLAIDPELGNKVKVTILATGFGLENVDGMSSHMNSKRSLEDAKQRADEQERKEELAERRGRFYDMGNKGQQKQRRHIFIFHPEDLDNEDIILAVESKPTYNRTRNTLSEIKNFSKVNNNIEEETKSENSDTAQNVGVISFA